MTRNKRKEQHTVSMWEAVRDIVIKAISSGQAVILGTVAFFVIAVYRMPSEDVGSLMRDILVSCRNGSIFGYALWVATVCAWLLHASSQRRKFRGEIRRMAEERDRLQELLHGKKMESSNYDG